MSPPPDGRMCPCPREGWHPLCAIHQDRNPEWLAAIALMYEPSEHETRVSYSTRVTVAMVACYAGAAAIVSTMAYRLLRKG